MCIQPLNSDALTPADGPPHAPMEDQMDNPEIIISGMRVPVIARNNHAAKVLETTLEAISAAARPENVTVAIPRHDPLPRLAGPVLHALVARGYRCEMRLTRLEEGEAIELIADVPIVINGDVPSNEIHLAITGGPA